MSDQKNSSFNSMIKAIPILKKFSQKLNELEILNNIVQEILDDKTKKHCTVANVKDDYIILSTTSPIWKHQVRFIQFEILHKIQTYPKFKHITKIKTIVTDISHNDLIRKNNNNLFKKPKISSQNAKVLSNMAEGITSPKLARAMKNIARHADIVD